MIDKDLKKLSRSQLLEIMIQQGKEIERLQQELDKANELLEKKEIMLKEAGSIAEASLKLNGVFEKAQQAADTYLRSIAKMHDDESKIYKNYEEICQRKCDELISKTKSECLILKARYEEKYANVNEDEVTTIQDDGGDACEQANE